MLWLPVTSHCLLKCVPGFEFLQCASHTAPDADDDDDGCDVVEAGFYQIEDNGPAVAPMVVAVDVFHSTPALDVAAAPAALPGWLTAAPPELPKVWQFSFRTALPPRAPSLVS